MIEDKLKIYGPLVVWSLLFLTSAIIKVYAFNDHNYWITFPSEISLWALGILFSSSASEQTYHAAKLAPKITKQKSGYSVEYSVTITDSVGFTPKYLYLFFAAIPIWIWTMLIAGHVSAEYAKTGSISIGIILSSSLSYVVSSAITISAIRVVREVSK